MKFDQLNMINIFLEKSYTKYDGEANSGSFYKKSKLSKSLGQQFEMFKCVFLCPSRGLTKYIKIKVLTTCFYLT